ncbi:MAG: hypothetical protein ABR861_10125 [Terriglobales bacterium]|jgi:hypothetical protein
MAEEEKVVGTEKSIDEAKTVTPEDFITRWPLYTPFDFPEFQPPTRISFHCGWPKCLKETTWALNHRKYDNEVWLWLVQYQCTLCQRNNIVVAYRDSQTGTRNVMGPSGTEQRTIVVQVQKIGQHPPLSIEIPKMLAKNLGEGATSLYKKGLINRNQGYGLGAITYIRRVVEDKTDELIEVVAQLAASHNIGPEIVKKIKAVKNERATYDQKLKLAATVLPESLMIDGANPLGVLYDLVSRGVHDLSEEECIRVADETKSVFEFTFTHLRAETKVRSDFVAKIKKLAGGK